MPLQNLNSGPSSKARVPCSVLSQPSIHLSQLAIGPLSVRLAETPQDFAGVQALRGQRFHPDTPDLPDGDRFDPFSLHLMVAQMAGGPLLATARLRSLTCASDFAGSYTAQSYGLSPLAEQFSQALEIGRLCIAPGAEAAPDILRALLAGVTALAMAAQAQVLMGCASFHGADVARHRAALAYLNAHHLGPQQGRPLRHAPDSVSLADLGPATAQGARDLPPLLRMYLAMGGWVSDHAVIDRELNTLHVLVAVPVATIPPARLRALGALLGPAALPLD